MDREHARAMLPLIQAFAEGETIEVLSGKLWQAVESPLFNNRPENYRIKPKPQMMYANIYTDGYVEAFADESHAKWMAEAAEQGGHCLADSTPRIVAVPIAVNWEKRAEK